VIGETEVNRLIGWLRGRWGQIFKKVDGIMDWIDLLQDMEWRRTPLNGVRNPSFL